MSALILISSLVGRVFNAARETLFCTFLSFA